jgi:hypothetical protein
VTRFHDGDFSPGHAPGKNKNEADRSRATKTGQLDELATEPRAGTESPWQGSGIRRRTGAGPTRGTPDAAPSQGLARGVGGRLDGELDGGGGVVELQVECRRRPRRRSSSRAASRTPGMTRRRSRTARARSSLMAKSLLRVPSSPARGPFDKRSGGMRRLSPDISPRLPLGEASGRGSRCGGTMR